MLSSSGMIPMPSPWPQCVRCGLRERLYEQRRKWQPVIKWMCQVIRRRLEKGRQFLFEQPWQSEMWKTRDMLKLLEDMLHDSMTGEPVEVVRTDQCEFGLCDDENGLLHMKPTGS